MKILDILLICVDALILRPYKYSSYHLLGLNNNHPWKDSLAAESVAFFPNLFIYLQEEVTFGTSWKKQKQNNLFPQNENYTFDRWGSNNTIQSLLTSYYTPTSAFNTLFFGGAYAFKLVLPIALAITWGFIFFGLLFINIPRNRIIFILCVPVSFFFFLGLLYLGQFFEPNKEILKAIEDETFKGSIINILKTSSELNNPYQNPFAILVNQKHPEYTWPSKSKTPTTFKYSIDSIFAPNKTLLASTLQNCTPTMQYPYFIADFKLAEVAVEQYPIAQKIDTGMENYLQTNEIAVNKINNFWTVTDDLLKKYPEHISDETARKLKVNYFIDALIPQGVSAYNRELHFKTLKQILKRTYLFEPISINVARLQQASRWGDPNKCQIPWAENPFKMYYSYYFHKDKWYNLLKGYGTPTNILYPSNVYNFDKYGSKLTTQLPIPFLKDIANSLKENKNEVFTYVDINGPFITPQLPENFPWKKTYLVHPKNAMLHEVGSYLPEKFISYFTAEMQAPDFVSWLSYSTSPKKEFEVINSIKEAQTFTEVMPRTQPAVVKILLFSFLTPNGELIVPLPVPQELVKTIKPQPDIFRTDFGVSNWREWVDNEATKKLKRTRQNKIYFDWDWNQWRNALCLFYPNEYGWCTSEETQKRIVDYVCTSLNKQLSHQKITNPLFFSQDTVKLLVYPEILAEWGAEHLKPKLPKINPRVNTFILEQEAKISGGEKKKENLENPVLFWNRAEWLLKEHSWNRHRYSCIHQAGVFCDHFSNKTSKTVFLGNWNKLHDFLTHETKNNYRGYLYKRYLDNYTCDIEPYENGGDRIALRLAVGDLPAFFWQHEMKWDLTSQASSIIKNSTLTPSEKQRCKNEIQEKLFGLSENYMYIQSKTKQIAKQLYPEVTEPVLDTFFKKEKEEQRFRNAAFQYRTNPRLWEAFFVNQYLKHNPETYIASFFKTDVGQLKKITEWQVRQLFQQNPIKTYKRILLVNDVFNTSFEPNYYESLYNAMYDKSAYTNKHFFEGKKNQYITQIQEAINNNTDQVQTKEEMINNTPTRKTPGAVKTIEFYHSKPKKNYQSRNAIFVIEQLKFETQLTTLCKNPSINKNHNKILWSTLKATHGMWTTPQTVFILFIISVGGSFLAITNTHQSQLSARLRIFEPDNKNVQRAKEKIILWDSFLNNFYFVWGGAGLMEFLSLEQKDESQSKLKAQTTRIRSLKESFLAWHGLSKTKVPSFVLGASMLLGLFLLPCNPVYVQIWAFALLIILFVAQSLLIAAEPQILSCFFYDKGKRWVKSRANYALGMGVLCTVSCLAFWDWSETAALFSQERVNLVTVFALLYGVAAIVACFCLLNRNKSTGLHYLGTKLYIALAALSASSVTTTLVYYFTNQPLDKTLVVLFLLLSHLYLKASPQPVVSVILLIFLVVCELLFWYSSYNPGVSIAALLCVGLISAADKTLYKLLDSETKHYTTKKALSQLATVIMPFMYYTSWPFFEYYYNLSNIAYTWLFFLLFFFLKVRTLTTQEVSSSFLMRITLSIMSFLVTGTLYMPGTELFITPEVKAFALSLSLWLFCNLNHLVAMHKNRTFYTAYLCYLLPLSFILYYNGLDDSQLAYTNCFVLLFTGYEIAKALFSRKDSLLTTQSAKKKLYLGASVSHFVLLSICELNPTTRLAALCTLEVLLIISFILGYLCFFFFTDAARSDKITDLYGISSRAQYAKPLLLLFLLFSIVFWLITAFFVFSTLSIQLIHVSHRKCTKRVLFFFNNIFNWGDPKYIKSDLSVVFYT